MSKLISTFRHHRQNMSKCQNYVEMSKCQNVKIMSKCRNYIKMSKLCRNYVEISKLNFDIILTFQHNVEMFQVIRNVHFAKKNLAKVNVLGIQNVHFVKKN